MKKKIFFMLAGVIIVLLVFSTYALSAVWYVKPDGSDSNSGDSWTDAFATIQQAINTANDGVDQIWVMEGNYNITSSIQANKSVAIYGGFPDSLADPQWSDRNWQTNITTVDGNSAIVATHCFVLTFDATIDGFTITNGDLGYSTEGGGIFNMNCNPTIRNCIFTGISEPMYGGALGNWNSSPLIDNCTFIGNSAEEGGAISSRGNSNATITNCTFDGNSAYSSGGAIYISDSSLMINNCTFSGNSAFGGGAISSGKSSNMITNCSFWTNSAEGGGAAIAIWETSDTITNCTFWGNITTVGDGDALNGQMSNVTMTNCILWNDNPGHDEIHHIDAATTVVNYCNIQGGYPGTGNIDVDPLFVTPASGDFHLQAGSLCIDAGNNTFIPSGITSDLDGEPRVVDGDGNSSAVVDMGAYEFHQTTTDISAPTAEMTEPSNTTASPTDTDIIVHVADTGSGVDQGTIVMTVESANVTPLITGNTSDFTLTYALILSEPPSKYERTVTVTVDASDLAGNAMSDSFSFTTESYSGPPFPNTDDDDSDGIPNDMEDNILHTNKSMKTLFVKPSMKGPTPADVYWPEFVTLLPLTPFVNAGIEIVVIGDSNNLYAPMKSYDYDPEGQNIPCDILAVRYMGSATVCTYGSNNQGHTSFEKEGSTWYWDTKGYTPNETFSGSNHDLYKYYKSLIYPFPLHNYFTEGAYPGITVGETPVVLNCTYNDCDMADHIPPTLRLSPMNLNDSNYTIPPIFTKDTQGNITDYGTVEFNSLFFCKDTESHGAYQCSEESEIWNIGSNPRGKGYTRKEVLRRTVVHEMGHALLDAYGGP
ncbi:MAG: choice-of-anchor Q domain-containing protein, partial [Desulfatiglandaceae bacterium]